MNLSGKGAKKNNYNLLGRANVPIVKVEKTVTSQGKVKPENRGKTIKVTEFVGRIEDPHTGDVMTFKLNELKRPKKQEGSKYEIHYWLEVADLEKA